MTADFAIVPAGDAGLVVEFADRLDPEVNDRVLALWRAVQAAGVPGVRDLVPAARSLGVAFDPLRTNVDRLVGLLEERARAPHPAVAPGPVVRVPVCYGGDEGPDLMEMAAASGLTIDEVVAAHGAPVYRVFMLGFSPGFTYMGPVDPRIALPRHATPRTRVNAGSVGIAGRQTGIYPSETPGGWRILGRTPLRPFRPGTSSPFLFSAGDSVQFYPVGRDEYHRLEAALDRGAAVAPPDDAERVEVVRPGLSSTIQDRGRWGWQASGVSVSGPMDPRAHRLANALVGNPDDAATLEITLVGPELVFESERTVAVCGADFVITIGDHLAASGAPFRVPAGRPLRFGRRAHGARAYLAVEGGFATDPVFGSRATHLPSRLGGWHGRPLVAGDRVPLGPRARSAAARSTAPHRLELPSGHARLRVLALPNPNRFRRDALDRLQSGRYTLRVESDRMGYRLEGPPIRTASAGDMLSEPSAVGAIQVPHDGQPILLMADRQTTGGYPTIGTVITADIGMAGQLGPGDTVAFTVCTRQDALAALIAQERALMAVR